MEDPSDRRSELKQRAAFEAVLASYQPGQLVADVVRTVKLVAMVGPTAAGRNTIIAELIKSPHYRMIVSDTTRKPRVINGETEKNGEVYWFKSEQEILDGLKSHDYLEAAIIHGQQVSGAHLDEFKKVSNADAIGLKEVEINGEQTYRVFNPDITSIFVLPPAFEVWMKRLRARSAMLDDELRRRLKSAENEIVTAMQLGYFHFIVNEDLADCARAIESIVERQDQDATLADHARDHAVQLLIDIRLFLQGESAVVQ